MKKFLLTISIFFCLAGNAFAVLPLILPIIGIGVGALIGGGLMSGVLYGLLPQAAIVANSGNISKPANAQWINASDINSAVPPVQSKDIKAELSLSKFRELSEKTKPDTSKLYPLIYAATHGVDVPLPQSTSIVNDVVMWAGSGWRVTGKTVSDATSWGYYDPTVPGQPIEMTGNLIKVFYGPRSPQGYYYIANLTVVSSALPPPSIYTNPKIIDNITVGVSSSNGDLEPSLQSELDKMYADPDYVPAFSDSTTGLPWVPPPDSATLSSGEIAAENVRRNADLAKVAALNSATAATIAATGAATTAAAGVSSAQGALTAATTAAAADPNNWAAQQIKAQTAADLIKAQNAAGLANIAAAGALAAENGLRADQAKEEEEEAAEGPAVGDNSVFGSGDDSDKPAVKGILGLLTEIASNSPLVSIIQSFTLSTSDSACVVPVGLVYGTDVNFDVCRWQAWLSACGGVLVILSHAYAVKVVAGGW